MGTSTQPAKLPPLNPPPSQVAMQAITGLPPVQAPPVASGVLPSATTSVTGSTVVQTYNQTKGKGNN